jgi:predicted amidohydrolase YtcJ
MPGFFDSHNHLLMTGLGMQRPGLAAATSVAAVLDVVRRAASALAAGQWLQTAGCARGDVSGPACSVSSSASTAVETGYHRDPYAYPDDPSHPCGKPLLDAGQLTGICRAAAAGGWHVGVHCVGDAGIDMVLDAFETTNDSTPLAGRRWTLIHMMRPRADHWERLNRLELTVTAQQPLMYSLAAGFERYLGAERARERGVAGPQWAITMDQALATYTSGSAWCAFQEDRLGTIDVGKDADIVVLSEDILGEPDSVAEAGVLCTISGGQVVHDAL